MEANQLRDSDDIEHISSLLAHISVHLKTSASYSTADLGELPVHEKVSYTLRNSPFKSIRMIPVRLRDPRSDTFVLRSSDDQNTWFVPDRYHLRKAFFGLVELAELSLLDSVQLNRLITGLDLGERCLSEVTSQNAFEAEKPTPLHEYTATLRKKVPYIHS